MSVPTPPSRRSVLFGGAAALGMTALTTAQADAVTEPVTVSPTDPRYLDLTRGMNQRYTAKPDYVSLPHTTDQVVSVLSTAMAGGKQVSLRSGGHCFEDFVHHDGVDVLMDLSLLSSVDYDADHEAFSVGAGAKLQDVYERLYRNWGVTIPGGLCYSVGAGGHVTGGGYGLLSRRDGLTVDHLYGVEVVVADGTRPRSLVVTRDSTGAEADLFWAHTGGGGGSFGVVTRFLFRSPGTKAPLVRPPQEVLLVALAVPWAELDEQRFTRIFGNYARWHYQNRGPGAPPLSSVLMMNHRRNNTIGLMAQIDAAAPDAERALAKYLDAVLGDTPAKELTSSAGEFGPMPGLARPRRLPWLAATRLLGTNTPVLTDPTLRAEHKSAYVRSEIPDEQLATAYRYLTRPDVTNPNAMLVGFSYGGAIAATDSTATAVAQRDSTFKLLLQSFWSTPDEDAANITWVREFYRDLYAETGGVPVPGEHSDGCYINYPDADLSDPNWNTSGVPWHTLYFKGNYPRLQRTKARWDPQDTFRHRHSIRKP
nr:FAD-binding protein [Kibdelosporangium sp. MJ126-NF4]CEL16448.1 secreted FAD-binding protein [Kibdelosporangium sp. MJ126-NF4]CTQ90400.1 secreted FAD-binding protein [Kibdelosporangium sp. MJ126-NF4]